MQPLTRDQFFAAVPAPVVEDVEVPGVGVVRVRQITAGERDRFEANAQGRGLEDIRARLLVACVVNAEGGPAFTYADIPRLTAMPAAALEPIVGVATRLNRITPADLDDLEKKSEANP